MVTENKALQQARGTAAQWESANPTLLEGEIGIVTDANYMKVGDGSSAWADLLPRAVSTSMAALQDAGFGENARNTFAAITLANREYMDGPGIGTGTYFPASITASQSGTTVTASTAVFGKEHVGSIIRWASGEEAVIVAVDNSGSSFTAITTCTVDRTQTVSSSSATVDARHIVGITYGDSLGNRTSPALQRLLYRALGFGGYIFHANNVESSQGAQVGQVTLAGSAADATADDGFADYPWGARWSVPSGGSLTFKLGLHWASGVERNTRHGLEPHEMKTDTAVLVWRRGAGALTVERKRHWDAEWESVATIADTSTGAANYNFAKYSHALGEGWEYRIASTSGTVNVVSLSMLNNSKPGYVHWPLSRGGENISDFDQLSSGELAELCRIVGQPSFRVIHAADGISGTDTLSAYTADLESDRALWVAAAPLMDHVWVENYAAGGNSEDEAASAARSQAIRVVAYENGDAFVPLRDLMGAYSATGLGLIEDLIHPSIKGSALIAHGILAALRLSDMPLIGEGRNVNARRGQFAALELNGADLNTRLRSSETKGVLTGRGLKWTTTGAGALATASNISAAIGTDDFTISLRLDVLNSPTSHMIAQVNSDSGSAVVNGGVYISHDSARLVIRLRDGSGNTIQYRWNRFNTVLNGKSGVLTIRSDVANTRFDIFWNGQPAMFLEGDVFGTTTSPLGTWSGTGQIFSIPQHSAAGTNFYHAGLWLSRLSDDEIRKVAETDFPAETAPELWWDFSDGQGRIVTDRMNNGRDGIILRSNPNQYNVDAAALDWAWPVTRMLGRPWLATINATSALLPGDNVITTQSSNRDWLLPATPAVGDQVRLAKATTALIRVTQPALHQIKTGAGATVGTDATTIGTSGRIAFDGDYDSVTLMCTRSEAGVAYEWVVTESPAGGLSWT